MNIVTSNRNYQVIISPGQFSADVTLWTFTVSASADMDIGDTATVNIVQNNGTAQTDISSSTRFTGHLVA